jgi:hypothetical protein
MKVIEDPHALYEFELSSGRLLSANARFVGIREEADQRGGFSCSGGYDESFYPFGMDWGDPANEPKAWTQAERDELADYMIDLWQRFKAARI